MRKLFILVLIVGCLINCVKSNAQRTVISGAKYTLSGYVRDSFSGEELIGSYVSGWAKIAAT